MAELLLSVAVGSFVTAAVLLCVIVGFADRRGHGGEPNRWEDI